MANEGSLLECIQDSEDAAAGLHRFRDNLPRYETSITEAIREFFAISAMLRKIQDGANGRRYGPSFYRIRDDLELVFRSLKASLQVIFDMFARTLDRPTQMAWQDLCYRFGHDERCDLQTRLQWYRDFLHCQHKVLEGQREDAPGTLRAQLWDLLASQDDYQSRPARRYIDQSGASTPRPEPRPRPRRLETPVSPITVSDEWDPYHPEMPPPFAPDAPPPLSPTYTSGSSQSMSSSFTSYSSDQYHRAPPLIHFAQNVFDGRHPQREYRPSAQLPDRSSCHGIEEPAALLNLSRDRFHCVLELNFEADGLGLRLYWRPEDHRARILIMTKDRLGRQRHFCQPLTNLKIIREASTLQLCRSSRTTGRFSLWARLNFIYHERMVLFYCTFVAMKRQDTRGVAHNDLVESSELDTQGDGEVQLFGGEMQHGDMLHALRLYRDQGSGVVRLEASALRGPKKDVPIWTVFVTRNSWDPDWPQLSRHGVVLLPAMRPPPYVFIARFEPLFDRHSGTYMLPFTSPDDAAMFMEQWSGLCRRHGGEV